MFNQNFTIKLKFYYIRGNNDMSVIKGYKVFNPDWTCRGFQYKVGEVFAYNGDIEVCKSGFHFCCKASDCFDYYSFDSRNKVAEVEAIGLVKTRGNKSVTDKIKIVREIGWYELLTIVNNGKNCTGLGNNGNWNSGKFNSGNGNTGYSNSGDYNSGDWNSTNYSTGFFNTEHQPIYMFNKPTNMSRNDIYNLEGMQVLHWNYKNFSWVCSKDMSAEEKAAHPEHETTGGYLKILDFKTACKMMWDKLDKEERQAVIELPNFDAKVFEDITGIKVNEDN